MSEHRNEHAGRRTFLAGASALAAGTMLVPPPAQAIGGRYAQSLRFLAEGSIRPDWVLSLLPLDLSEMPPGTVVKGRFEFPTPMPAYRGKDVMSLYIYAVLPFPAPEVPVSAFHVAIEHIALDMAPDAGLSNPANNLAMSGRVASVEVRSPFGDLTGRTFAFGCGFAWLENQRSSAVFKLLAGSVAGSHVTVAEEASGYIGIKRPWPSY